jgi:hypothetical protein
MLNKKNELTLIESAYYVSGTIPNASAEAIFNFSDNSEVGSTIKAIS